MAIRDAKPRTFHPGLVVREVNRSRQQAVIFMLCVILAIVTLVAVNGLSDSVDVALSKDAKSLHAGDIIVRSRRDFTAPLLESVQELKAAGRIDTARYYQFYTMARTLAGEASLLTSLKVVQGGYPFYGRCELGSGRSLDEVLEPGRVVVEQRVLETLGLALGDPLRLGNRTLTIADVLLKEPDRPLDLFSFGPRIFVSAADLDSLGLLNKGSRIRYVLLLKVYDETQLDRIAGMLAAVADTVQERVDTYRSADSGIKRFFDNFLLFLSLVGIFTLLLAGIGIHSALTAYLREKYKTVAILKTLGATGRFIIVQHTCGILCLGLLGTAIGLALGGLVQALLPRFFTGVFPEQVQWQLSWRGLIEGLGLGGVVVALFAFLPLYRLRNIRPAYVFRQESAGGLSGGPYYACLALIGLFFGAMVLWQLPETKTALFFTAGLLGFLGIISLAARLNLSLLRRRRFKKLAVRQAFNGLFRPRNATRSIVTALSAAASVLFSIYLINANLHRAFVQSYPPDSPNLFFLDIQPDQREAFDRTLGMDTQYYPLVRAKILSVNAEPIERSTERRPRRGDTLTRTFNLTYRDYLLDDEVLVDGQRLFRDDWDGAQVSVLDTVLEMKPMQIGDRIEFRIQGIPIEARISSIRSRTSESLRPFFYFVLQERVLGPAPQTIFTAVRAEKHRISAIRNTIVGRFPNVSVIDLSDTLQTVSDVVQKLARVVTFFTAFSIVAGLLIVVSSVYATRRARTREAAYYQVLGATRRFVVTVFTLENIFLGGISAVSALFFSHLIGWVIVDTLFEITYKPIVSGSILMVIVTVALVVVFGLLPSWSAFARKPARVLRQQTRA
jgi:putative ABC transport system permease protein